MFAAYQLKDFSIEDFSDLSNNKRTKLSQSDSIILSAALQQSNRSNYLRSIIGASPLAAKSAQPRDHKSQLLKSGSEAEASASESFKNSIKPYVNPDGSVDAGAMMDNWFSDYNATVFISHARADKELALAFAGWVMEELKIVAFIDSCVWLHANDLLKGIDNKWCYQKETKTYAYESRNISTAHVYMMLATALTKMMDRCECVFFLNTKNSVSSKSIKQMVSGENESTHSPWLFHEISMMKMLRRRSIEEHRAESVQFSKGVKKAAAELPPFDYPIDLAGLPVLSVDNVIKWHEGGAKQNAALDLLYKICPPSKP